MSSTSNFIERAKRGESVFLYKVKEAYDLEGVPVKCTLVLAGGEVREFTIGLPVPDSAENEAFIKDYFYARVYNIISMLGGSRMVINAPNSVSGLLSSLDEVFGINVPRKERMGYQKCLNVTDRMNAAFGEDPFRFEIDGDAPESTQIVDSSHADVIASFKRAVNNAGKALICGMDVGGTDIKIVGSKYGRVGHIKEYDWNPSAFPCVDGIVDTIMLFARLSRALLSLPSDIPEHIMSLKDEVLDKDAPLAVIGSGIETLEAFIGEVKPLDGIGLSFPDVVVRDKIVGGETHKTKGAREHSPDYETEFKRVTTLNEKLHTLCRAGAPVHLTNDGNIAAYTAAVELAHSDMANDVLAGMFAHTLGTELGTGWVNENGEVPEYPLEVYNCIIDLGNFIAKSYSSIDLRSINNFNTGISGTLQRFTSQSGAFRLAEQYYKESAPDLYQELFDKGFIARTGENLAFMWEASPTPPMIAAVEPVDMRKPFLEHLMAQAENGVELAMRIFEHIGECLAATWLETEGVLQPEAKARVLYGRFVKRRSCYDLMLKGAKRVLPDIVLLPADDELAFTPLMCELRDNKSYSVAQFGQAVGAVYFAAGETQNG